MGHGRTQSKGAKTSLSVFTFLVAVVAGAAAAISGFGVGGLLTPLLAARYGTRLAVAIVSVPHLIAAARRFAGLRKHLNRRIFLNFAVLSAVGGLLGALLNARADSPVLAIVFGRVTDKGLRLIACRDREAADRLGPAAPNP